MYELKTNTAARIVVGPAVDPDDLLAKLSLDVTDISVQICRMAQDGSAVILSAFTPTASGGDNDMVHISGATAGMYDLELTASQLNFLGPARIILYDEDKFIIHWVDILVLSAAYYDWKYGSTIPEVDLVLIDGETIDVTEAQLGVNVVEADSIAWEDEERLSKLDVIQENTTDIKRVTDNISSSTRAVCDNTKISAAAGYAFIDFGDAAIFANHIASHSKLVITDSAGKKLVGYVKAAGTGETYGAEQAKNPTFDADATSWSQYGCTLTSSYPAGGGHNNDYGILTSKGSGEEHGTSPFILQSIIMPTGCLCTVGGHIKNGNKPNLEVRIYKTADGHGRAVGFSSSSWSEIRGYFTERGYKNFYIQAMRLSVANETVFIDEIFCRQVLTPSATGVTITSTPGGDIFDWASKDDDFNYYDASGYTITLPGTQPDLSYPEKQQMLNNLDAAISTRAAIASEMKLISDYDAAKTAATQASVNAIPTTPVLASDARLNNLDATITSRLADSKYVAPANDDIAAIKAKTDNLPASPAAVGSEMVLTSAYDAAKTAASQSSVNAIPTNPLLTNDARLANLDATISSRSTLTAAQVWANSTRTLSSFGSLIADIAAAVWGSAARTLTAISDSAGVTTLLSRIGAALTITGGKVDVNDKTGFGLTTGERTAIANEVEAQIIDDTDSEKVLQAIVDKIAAVNPSLGDLTLATIASAIRAELATELGRIDAAVSTRLATSGYTAPANADIAAIKAKTDNLPAAPAAVGSEMTLTAAYDAAKTAASQSSVNSIPTNPLLTNDARLNNLNATIASRLAADNYTAPANDNITAIKAVTDKLDDTLELADGKNRFTEAALAEGPAADVSAVVDDLVDGFLDAQLTGHDIVGSVGAAIAASSASGDPWTTELPGTYAAGTAGNIIGTKTASAEEIREELDTRSSKFSILGRILKF